MKKTDDAAAKRFAAEAEALAWLLNERTQDELARLAERLRLSVKAMVGIRDLQPELAALMGPKAEALPDCIVTLYLREVPTFTLGEFRRHLARFAEPIEVEQWLRFMGIARLGDREFVPRPRFFPRRMLAADMAKNPDKTAATSTTTYNRCLQLLSLIGLIREAPANNLGALDTQVTCALLELVEREIAAVPLTKVSRHPRDIREVASTYVHRIVGAFALAFMLGGSDPSHAEGFATCPELMGSPACTSYSEWAVALTGPAAWNTASAGLAASDWTARVTESVAQDTVACGHSSFGLGCIELSPMGIVSDPTVGVDLDALRLAALEDVILGSRKLIGPLPSPQPVEPLQRSSLVPFVDIAMP